MIRSRHGICLIEIMVGVAIIAGPVFVAMDSLTSGTRATRLNANHLALELLVTDLADQLCAEARDRLDALTPDEGDELVCQLAETRVAEMPSEELAEAARNEAAAIRDLKLTIEPVKTGDFGTMYRVVVTARSTFGGIVRGLRLVQIPPRPPPQPSGPPPGPTP